MLALKIALIAIAWGEAAAGMHRTPTPGMARTGFRPHDEELGADYWYHEASEGIRRRQRHHSDRRVAKNVVMFLGDGMSGPTLAAARALLGQRAGRPGEEAELSFEAFPTVGLAKTYCVDHQTADSACSATAYLCGVKNNLGMVGLTGAVPLSDCDASLPEHRRVESIAAWALADGRDAGIVTTTRITHASPSGAYAKCPDRYWESDGPIRNAGVDPELCPDIAYQLIHHAPGKDFKVILGGGRREFLPSGVLDEEGDPGIREDGQNLTQHWIDQRVRDDVSHAYVWNRDQLMELYENPPEYLLGLFENSHLMYNLQTNAETEPTLTELTEIAIRSLRRNEKGFFLFVEGGRIDHAHHDNLAHLALDETIELSKAVQRATELLSEDDSLIVVTADHSHVMALNGYSARGSDILGVSDDLDRFNVSYMTLSYTNGPGARVHVGPGLRPDVREEENYGALDWENHADVPLEWETHGGDDVAVFARGPHHALFSGLYEQSQIPHLMAYAGCIPGGSAVLTPHCNSAADAKPALLGAVLLSLFYMIRAHF